MSEVMEAPAIDFNAGTKGKGEGDAIWFDANGLTNEAYHAETEHVSGTSLFNIFSTCLAKWRFAENEKKEKSKPLLFGTAAHANQLEPEAFAASYYRMPEKEEYPDVITSMEKAKAWLKAQGVAGYSKMNEDELIATVRQTSNALGVSVNFWHEIQANAVREAGDRIQIRGADFDIIQRMREVLFKNEQYRDIIVNPAASEISIFGTFAGVKVKARLDKVTKNAELWDYKTADSCEPEKFGRRCYDLGYPMKMALQHHLFKQAWGRRPERVVLLVQEKDAPFLVTDFALTRKTLQIGYAQLREAVAMYQYAKENDIWPGYNGGNTVELDPPFYVARAYEHLWKDEQVKQR